MNSKSVYGEDLQVWTVGTGPVLSNSFLSDFYGKNYPNKGVVLYTMIHTYQLEQPCYLVDKHGPHIVVHSYKLVILYKFSFGDLLKHQDFERKYEISKKKGFITLLCYKQKL